MFLIRWSTASLIYKAFLRKCSLIWHSKPAHGLVVDCSHDKATQQHILGLVGDFSHEATRCDKARQCLARSSGRLLTWYDTIRCDATQRDSYLDDIKIEADSYGAIEPSTTVLEEGDRHRLIEYMEVDGCKPKDCKRWPTLWRMPPALSGDRRRSEKGDVSSKRYLDLDLDLDLDLKIWSIRFQLSCSDEEVEDSSIHEPAKAITDSIPNRCRLLTAKLKCAYFATRYFQKATNLRKAECPNKEGHGKREKRHHHESDMCLDLCLPNDSRMLLRDGTDIGGTDFDFETPDTDWL